MLNFDAVIRVVEKRQERGATDNDIIKWLSGLKKRSWKQQAKKIDDLIDAIRQTPY